MKKFITPALGCALLAPVAYAQSSTTLYGIVDTGVSYTSNVGGKSLVAMTAGNLQGNRWGLMGTEQLGNGLSAIFKVESGFSSTTGALGQGGAMFGRQAWVGLSDKTYGALTLGRQYDPLVEYVAPVQGGTSWGSLAAVHPGDYDNMANSYRLNNSVKYRYTSPSGIAFSVAYAFGNVAGSMSRNRIIAVGGGYKHGPVEFGVAYLNINDPNYSFYGNNPSSSTTASNITNVVFAGFASAKNEEIIATSGALTFGGSTVGLIYTNTRFNRLGYQTGIRNLYGKDSTAMLNNVEVNYRYQIGPAWTIGAAYDFTYGSSLNGHEGARYHQFNVGTDYKLSVRTDLYLAAVYQHADGYDSLNRPAVANLTGTSASSSANQLLVTTGIRHKF